MFGIFRGGGVGGGGCTEKCCLCGGVEGSGATARAASSRGGSVDSREVAGYSGYIPDITRYPLSCLYSDLYSPHRVLNNLG